MHLFDLLFCKMLITYSIFRVTLVICYKVMNYNFALHKLEFRG